MPTRPLPRGGAERAEVADLERLAWLLDSRFRVPLTPFRFGVDALLGLAPGIGDAASALISLYILTRAHRLGAPAHLLRLMFRNVVVDTAFGAFPVVGDLFDIGFRSNLKNIRLLFRHLERANR